MTVILWILISYLLILVGIMIYKSISRKEIILAVNKKLFNNKALIISNNFMIEERKSNFVVVEKNSKKLLIYGFDQISEIQEISEKKCSSDDKINISELPIIFSDGYVCPLTFENKLGAFSAREKIKVAASVFQPKSETDEPIDTIDISNLIQDHEKEKFNIIINYSIMALIFIAVGSAYNLYNSESRVESRAEKAREQAREQARRNSENIERACSDPRHSANTQTYQFVREIHPGRISIVRESVRGRLIGDCRFKVTGAFEGENIFGAKVRNYYVMTIRGSRRATGVTWYGSVVITDSDPTVIRRLYWMD